jgi:hypothetical protein
MLRGLDAIPAAKNLVIDEIHITCMHPRSAGDECCSIWRSSAEASWRSIPPDRSRSACAISRLDIPNTAGSQALSKVLSELTERKIMEELWLDEFGEPINDERVRTRVFNPGVEHHVCGR